mmetsp:Transcript_51278/g.95575  ORF Transcript_51278/g.95575 Transcript_51278/m.95575 type:complete len:186 (-) Transcript_51278:2532-3089(-)
MMVVSSQVAATHAAAVATIQVGARAAVQAAVQAAVLFAMRHAGRTLLLPDSAKSSPHSSAKGEKTGNSLEILDVKPLELERVERRVEPANARTPMMEVLKVRNGCGGQMQRARRRQSRSHPAVVTAVTSMVHHLPARRMKQKEVILRRLRMHQKRGIEMLTSRRVRLILGEVISNNKLARMCPFP